MTTPLPRSEFAVTQRYLYLNHAAAGVLPASTVAAVQEFAHAHAAAGVLGTFPYDLEMVRVPGKDRTLHRRVGRGDRNDSQHQRRGGNDCARHRLEDRATRCCSAITNFPPTSSRGSRCAGAECDVRLLPLARGTPDAGAIAARDRAAHARRHAARGSPTSMATGTISPGWPGRARGRRTALRRRDARFGRAADRRAHSGRRRALLRRRKMDARHCTARRFSTSARVSRRISRSRCPGWRSLEDMWDFHNYEQPFTREALRFEGGTPNLLGTLSLACAIDLFNASGPRTDRRACVDAHRSALRRPCGACGATFSTERGERCSSGIVTFAVRGPR